MRSVHGHEATLDDALDFINTLHFESDEHAAGTHDQIGEVGAGVDWLAERGLAHRPRDPDDRAIDEARATEKIGRCRDAMRELFDATVEQRRIRREALAELNRVLRHREVIELVADDSGARLDHRHVGDPVDDALARLAEALARVGFIDQRHPLAEDAGARLVRLPHVPADATLMHRRSAHWPNSEMGNLCVVESA